MFSLIGDTILSLSYGVIEVKLNDDQAPTMNIETLFTFVTNS